MPAAASTASMPIAVPALGSSGSTPQACKTEAGALQKRRSAPSLPVLSSATATSTLKGVQASCWPRQAPWDTAVASTAGAASTLRGGKAARRGRERRGARQGWRLSSVAPRQLRCAQICPSVYTRDWPPSSGRQHPLECQPACRSPDGQVRYCHHLMERYCQAGTSSSGAVPMAAKKVRPPASSAAAASRPQATASCSELHSVRSAASRRASLRSGRGMWPGARGLQPGTARQASTASQIPAAVPLYCGRRYHASSWRSAQRPCVSPRSAIQARGFQRVAGNQVGGAHA